MSAISYFCMRGFQFFRFICLFCLTLFSLRASDCPSFIHAESVHEFALLACIPVWFFKVRVIINGCIFMSELLFGLCFRFCFKQNPQVFVLNKCVLWLQSRSCFRAIFSFLTLSSVFITRGLISLIFLSPPDVIYSLFCGSKAEVVLRQFLVTWPCRACLRTRDLILPNFITPWSC